MAEHAHIRRQAPLLPYPSYLSLIPNRLSLRLLPILHVLDESFAELTS